MNSIMIEINGKPHVSALPEQCSVLQCLREELGLNGPKLGCGEGECGACTVLVDAATPESDLSQAYYNRRMLEIQTGAAH